MTARSRLKLLVLTSTFPRWTNDTTPTFVADLCASLAQTMDVTVLAPASDGAALIERQGGVDVRRFRYMYPARLQRLADGAIMPNIRRSPLLAAEVPPFVFAELGAAWRLMRREHFDVVHAHWALPQGFLAALLKHHFGVPLITTVHGGDVYALRSGAALRAKRWALTSSDRVTAVSSSLKREVVALGVDEDRVDVLPMGVDTTSFTPDARSEPLRHRLNPEGPVILFVGRLVEKKGARYAIEAMPRVLAHHPDARLVIVGEGPERARLQQVVYAHGLGREVHFAGPIANADLPAYYASSDVFLGPSVVEPTGDTESFGVVFAEAMASGCPVVATDVGGIGDVTSEGEHAALVPQRDAGAIAEAVMRLLADEDAHAATRRRAVDVMRTRFDHRRIHAEYERLIRDLAA